MEDFCHDPAILGKIRGFPQLLAETLVVFKTGKPVAPILFQPEHGVPASAKEHQILFQ